MSNKLRFIWIDDLPGRRAIADNLSKALDIDIVFWDVHKKDLEKEIKAMLSGTEPDLIIIDHKLEDIQGYFNTGSTAAAIIKETWPECPIICVSGVDMKDFGLTQRDIYDAIFSDSDISKHYATILSIAIAYRYFKGNRPENVDHLLALLGDIEEDDRERLGSVLPTEIKDNLHDPAVIRHISNWIRNTLFKRPGFLYDYLWTSTFIGVKPASFKKVEKIFEPARFNGLFFDQSRPRWWKSKLLNLLSENAKGLGLPWENGRDLPGLTSDDFSISYVSNEPFPETVAFVDDTHKERYPMKLKETVADHSFQDLLYFEEIRKMMPAQ